MKNRISNLQQSLIDEKVKENIRISRKQCFVILSLVFSLAISVCVIVDIAVTNELTWSLYPLLSIAYVWLICTSLLAKKNSLIIWLFLISATLLPYLFLLEKLTPIDDWFNELALPIAIIGIASLWICSFVVKYLKRNKWFMIAAIVFILCVVVAILVNIVVFDYMGEEVRFLNTNFLYIPVSALLSVIFCITGFIKRKSGNA